jgi:hypothetical protein
MQTSTLNQSIRPSKPTSQSLSALEVPPACPSPPGLRPCVNVAAVAAPHLNLRIPAPQTWIDCFGDVFDDRVRIKVQLD